MPLVYLYIDVDNYVNGWSSSEDVGTIAIDVPEDHGVLTTPRFYKYENNDVILDEIRRQEILDSRNSPPPPTEIEVLRAEVERLQEKQFESDMALMDIVETMFGEM